MPRHASRLPVWGLGCAGAVGSLARGAELVRATQAPILVVAAELCSVTFITEDRSTTNLVSTSLFADGAAAVVLTTEGPGPEVVGSFSQLFDETDDIVAWDIVNEGLKVRLARSTPQLVYDYLQEVLRSGTGRYGLTTESLRHYALHPGGAKVLTAYQDALGLPNEALAPARSVLRDYGNMSSPTALFVLERILQTVPPSAQPGVLLAPGPGFSAEGVLFKW